VVSTVSCAGLRPGSGVCACRPLPAPMTMLISPTPHPRRSRDGLLWAPSPPTHTRSQRGIQKPDSHTPCFCKDLWFLDQGITLLLKTKISKQSPGGFGKG